MSGDRQPDTNPDAAPDLDGAPRPVGRFWLPALGVLLLAASLLAGWWWRIESPLAPTGSRVAVADPDCSLRDGPCRARFADGATLSLTIAPRPIPTVAPLRLEVALTGIPEVSGVEVDFAGVEMDMGYNRVRLTAAESGLHRGQALLPVCVSARMTWEASVLVRTPAGLLIAPFRFETTR